MTFLSDKYKESLLVTQNTYFLNELRNSFMLLYPIFGSHHTNYFLEETMLAFVKLFFLLTSVIFTSMTLHADDIGKCNPNRTFIAITSKTRFCGYFNMTTSEANEDEKAAYLETMKLALSGNGLEVIYGKNISGKIVYKFYGGALNKVDEKLNNDILNGSIVEIIHTHPWFSMNAPNPSGPDREAFAIWASNSKKIVFKIIHSPSIEMNASISEVQDYISGKKMFKVSTSTFYPQFAD